MKKLFFIILLLLCFNISAQIETISKTLHVKQYPIGNDTTADGSIDFPYHSIEGVLNALYDRINARIEIQFGQGEWNWGLDNALEMERFRITGHDFIIRGTWDTVLSNLNLQYTTNSLLNYNAYCQENITENQFKGKSVVFHKVNSDGIVIDEFYPISYNSAGNQIFSLQMAKSKKNLTNVVICENKTIFNLTDKFALDFNLLGQNRGTLNFDNIVFKSEDNIEHERLLRQRKYRNCNFYYNGELCFGAYSEAAINQVVTKGCWFESTSTNHCHTVRLKRFFGSWQMARCVFNGENMIILSPLLFDAHQNSLIILTDIIVLGNQNVPAIQLQHSPQIHIKKPTLLKNCKEAFSFVNHNNDTLTTNFELFALYQYEPGQIYLENTNYLMDYPVNNINVILSEIHLQGSQTSFDVFINGDLTNSYNIFIKSPEITTIYK